MEHCSNRKYTYVARICINCVKQIFNQFFVEEQDDGKVSFLYAENNEN